MTYQVLARKWRPRSFSALVGQEHVVRALTHSLQVGRLHHAYLFTGTRGVGKTTIARILAKALNCETGISAEPCGVCPTCKEIEAGNFVDLLEVDAATNTRVEEMRQLLENAVYAPTRGRFKVYVIDEVHMLSASAFNSMLKTLEEPPEHVKFILATTDPQKIPVTVLSRCLQFNLKQMPKASISNHLASVLAEEGVDFESPAIELIAKAANGSMRDALSILDQAIAHGAGSVREENLAAMLGIADSERIIALVEHLVRGEIEAVLKSIEEMSSRSYSFDNALEEMAALFVRAQLCLCSPDNTGVLDDTWDARVRTLAQAMGTEFVHLAYRIAIVGRDELRLAPDPKSGFTMVVLRLHAFSPGASSEGRPTPDASGKALAKPASVELAPSRLDGSSNDRRSEVKELDWNRVLGEMSLSGMTRELAQHCEVEAWSPGKATFRLAPVHRHLLVSGSQERLQQALSAYQDRAVRLTINLADPAGETPAARQKRVKQEIHSRAIESIESDDFVRRAVDVFDARIVDSSISSLPRE